MKTLTALILTALLAACGDCPPEAAPLPVAEVSVPTPAPVVRSEPDLELVTPQLCPDGNHGAGCAPTPSPSKITLCEKNDISCQLENCQKSSAGCQPSPTPAPNRPIVIEPNPEPICTRNNEPLVMIDGVLTDNCGNKYGTTK